jgi:hypothetical protein
VYKSSFLFRYLPRSCRSCLRCLTVASCNVVCETVLKLQNSQSGTVNNLLEEVRRAEENVARERKKAASEVGRCLE